MVVCAGAVYGGWPAGLGGMIGPELIAAIGFIVMLLAQAFGVWKYVSGEMKSLRLEAATKAEAAATIAAMARADLAEYKTHVAENFATKDGMQRQTDSLLRAIESIGSRIDGLNERLDRAFEARSTSGRRAS